MRRRGRLGLRLSADPAPVVREVAAESAAARAGLRVGDRIEDPTLVRSRCRAGDSIALRVLRGDAVSRLELVADPWPEERHEGLSTRYGEIVGMRMISVSPARPRATVLYVQGCDLGSVERALAPDDDPLVGWVRHLGAAGYATLRVEREGVGDSEGDDPGAVDWSREREGVASALAQAEGERVVLFGHSLGAMHAAAVAARDPRVCGIIAYGAGVDPWRAYLAEHLRRQLTLARVSERELEAQVEGALALWSAALDGSNEVTGAQGDRSRHRAGMDARGRLHGRTPAYWRGVDREDPAVALRALEVPVLALWGASDWLSTRREHEAIAALTRGVFEEVPEADHGFARFESAQASFDAGGRGRWCPAVGDAALRWMAREA